MASKAELKAKVTLNSGPFRKGLKRLRGFTRRFSRNFGAPMAQATKNMVRMGVVAGTVLAAGLAVAAKSVANYLDEIDKMSIRTGIATEKLAALGIAAQLGGSNLGDVEKAMKRMATNLVDANKGLKTSVDAFADLGIEVESFARLKPGEQFDIILKKIAAIPNATKRAGLAQKIFGRAGTALIPVINNLKIAAKLSKEFGLDISPEQAKAGADFNDMLTLMKFAIKGLFIASFGFKDVNKGISDLIHRIVTLRKSKGFQNFVRMFKSGTSILVKGIFTLVKTFGILASEQGKNFRTMIKNVGILLLFWKSGFLIPILKMMGAIALGIAAPLMSVALPALAAFVTGVAALNIGAALNKAFNVSGFIAKILRIGEAIKTFTGGNKVLGARMSALEKQLKADFAAIDDLEGPKVDFFEELEKQFDKSFGKIGDVGKKIFDKLKKQIGDKLPIMKGIEEAMNAWKKASEDINLGEQFEGAVDDAGALDDIMTKLANSGQKFRGGFAKASEEIKKNVRTLEDVARNKAIRDKEIAARRDKFVPGRIDSALTSDSGNVLSVETKNMTKAILDMVKSVDALEKGETQKRINAIDVRITKAAINRHLAAVNHILGPIMRSTTKQPAGTRDLKKIEEATAATAAALMNGATLIQTGI